MTIPGPALASLSRPTDAVHTSFLAGMTEFQAKGRGRPDDDSMLGRQLRRHNTRWHTPAGFAAFIDDLLADALPDTPRPAGFVPSTQAWQIAGATILGRVSIRHALTERLRDSGGHIGYDVVPSARRHGHATAMLTAALHVAADLGIRRALLTCMPTNLTSQRVIEHNGGILASTDQRVLRFWIPTS